MHHSVCRIVIDPEPSSGVWNMAVDESLLESAVGSGVCTVRVYEWARPTISLGYFQPFPAADGGPDAAEAVGDLPVVRRLTGGGAILHHLELTYSCCVPSGHPAVQDPRRLCRCVHEGILACLAELGVDAAQLRGQSKRADSQPFLCFGRGDPNDILLDGHKILGSAQRRRRGAVLQHGSLLLNRSPHAPEFPGLVDLRPDVALPADLPVRLARFIGMRLSADVEAGTLTDSELTLAHRLRDERYSNRRWTEKPRKPS